MTRVISISQNKGGVLKTSLVVNLAGVLAIKGKKVLIIDTDNQGNALISFNQNPDKCQYTLYDVLVDGLPVQHVIMNVHENIDVLPSNDDMSFFELDVLPERFWCKERIRSQEIMRIPTGIILYAVNPNN